MLPSLWICEIWKFYWGEGPPTCPTPGGCTRHRGSVKSGNFILGGGGQGARPKDWTADWTLA